MNLLSENVTTQMRRYSILISVLVGLSACAPGHLEWSDGEDQIRTALWVESPDLDAPEYRHAQIVLSNGEFGCWLPLFPFDPDATVAAQARYHYALCREGAHHVVLDVYRRGSVEPGTYRGDTVAAPGSDAPRAWSQASYIAIDEAASLSSDNLTQVQALLEFEEHRHLGDGGEVVLDRTAGPELRGEFSFPDAEISGRFTATRCSAEAGPGESYPSVFDAISFASGAGLPVDPEGCAFDPSAE